MSRKIVAMPLDHRMPQGFALWTSSLDLSDIVGPWAPQTFQEVLAGKQ